MMERPLGPPYSVPSMDEIAEIPSHGLTVATTFAGCGGSSLGYKMAGFKVVWANEFHSLSAECYELNSGLEVNRTDIREVVPEDVMKATGLGEGELDVLDGSPPCQSFSVSGKRAAGWGKSIKRADGTEQVADDLFFEFARLLRGLQPRMFVAENVEGLVRGVAIGYYKRIFKELQDCGYLVRARVLNAKWLGVPQSRRRVILIGARRDLEIDPTFPTPLGYFYSVIQACPWIGSQSDLVQTVGRNVGQRRGLDRESPAVMTTEHNLDGAYGARIEERPGLEDTVGRHKGRQHDLEDAAATILSKRDQGSAPRLVYRTGFNDGKHQYLDEAAPAIQAAGLGGSGHDQVRLEYQGKGREAKRGRSKGLNEASDVVTTQGMFGEEAPHLVYSSGFYKGQKTDISEKPSRAVTASGISGSGDSYKLQEGPVRRRFTIGEVRRLCSFPDDFQLIGSFSQQWARLGNAVPPLMMRAVAREVARALGKDPPE